MLIRRAQGERQEEAGGRERAVRQTVTLRARATPGPVGAVAAAAAAAALSQLIICGGAELLGAEPRGREGEGTDDGPRKTEAPADTRRGERTHGWLCPSLPRFAGPGGAGVRRENKTPRLRRACEVTRGRLVLVFGLA